MEELEQQVRAMVPEADLRTEEPSMQQALEVAFKAAASEATMLAPRRERHRQGRAGAQRFTPTAGVRPGRSSRSTARACRPSCSRASCSVTLAGAFTGAVHDTLGKVAAAEGGTLFLDEVGELPPALQAKLLRLLAGESGTSASARRSTRASDVRILAATNRDLEADAAAGRFREDLLYRLNVIEVVAAAAATAAGRHPAAGRASAAVFRPAKR